MGSPQDEESKNPYNKNKVNSVHLKDEAHSSFSVLTQNILASLDYQFKQKA